MMKSNSQVVLDNMDNFLKNKTLLVTGGTGSFGNTVVKKFLGTELKKIRIFSRDEKKQEEMRLLYNSDKLEFILGDVRDLSSLDLAMKDVDYVFHAAALKQVPSCEFYPMEAIKTNIHGTENVITAAISANVKKVIILSTDKAVYPINAMGLSKALAEKIMVARSRNLDPNKTILCATRYGNVAASRGSVIPLFVSQIKAGKSITITDPNMTRFLMSLNDSVNLVMHAFEHAQQGDIFVQKAPASTIADLANALQDIFASQNPISMIGTRHGEKIYESLVSREEMAHVEDMGNFFRVPADNRNLNYENYFTRGDELITRSEDYTSHNAKRLNAMEIKEFLLSLDYIKEEMHA